MTDFIEINPDSERPNALQIFDYGQQQIRTILVDEKPWAAGSDIATALGYSDPDDAIRRHCKLPKLLKPGETPGLECGPRGMVFIPEPDIYRLSARSKLPAAEKFEEWIFEDVIPTIRKTGRYGKPPEKKFKAPTSSKLASELDIAARVAKFFGMNTNQALLSANQSINKTYGIDLMQALQIPHLVQEEQEIEFNVTNLGKRLGYSAREMNKVLENTGLQNGYRDGKNRPYWQPTTKGNKFCVIKDVGKKKGSGTPVTQIFWKESVIDYLQQSVGLLRGGSDCEGELA